MRVKRKNVATILNKIWESQLNIWFGWSCDGDICYKINREGSSRYYRNTGQQNIQVGLEMMCKNLIEFYPESEFAYWFMKTFNYNPFK